MMRSLFTGVSGLKQEQTRMDVLSNNIANVNTTGFKRGRVLFQDLFSETIRNAQQAFGSYGGLNPMQVGLGVQLGSIDTLMEQGGLETTGKDTDLAIEGAGFFVVKAANGNNYYTRDGNFNINPNYDLVSANTGFQIQGWLSTQNPVTGNLELNDTGTIPTQLNIVKFLKKHAHQTNNITYASNLDSGSDERDVKMGVDYLAFKNTAGNDEKLQLKFQKVDSTHWVWSAIDDTQGNVANGLFTTDANGNLIESSVEPAGPTSTAANPYFVYDPDGNAIPASASTALPASGNVGNGSSSAINASGSLVKDEKIDIIFDGGDPARATTFRVVGEQRGFIGGGTLGGTQAEIKGNPWKFENGWKPSNNVSFQITEVQNLEADRLQTKENRATVSFNGGTTYTAADIRNLINSTLANAGISAQAQYDSTTKQFSIVDNQAGSNRTLMMDKISGPVSELGFDAGTQGGTDFLSNYSISYAVEPFNITQSVIFQVTDNAAHTATVKLTPGAYTRNQIQSTIQNALSGANVQGQVSFVDSNNDSVPDRLRITANGGSTIQITDVQNLLTQMGINPVTLGSNTYQSELDMSFFVDGVTSSRDFSGPDAFQFNFAQDVTFRIEDQYPNNGNDDPATNVITVAAGNYTRAELRDTIQNQISALNLPAQVVFVDTDADGVPNQLQINGLIGERIRVTDTSATHSLTSELGITPTNQWTPDRDISFQIDRPDYNTSITVTLPMAHPDAPFSAETLQSTLQNLIDQPDPAGFGPGVVTVELIDANGDGVKERFQLRANNPAERIRLENDQNISLLGLKSGVNNTGTGGAPPQVYSLLDFSGNTWNPTSNVSFIVSDANGHAAEVVFPDLDASNNQISYKRTDILSIVNAELRKNNVAATASFIDSNNDKIDDTLVFTGSQSGAGQKITITGDNSVDAQLRLFRGTYSGTAAVANFDQGGLAFSLTEGTKPWQPNESLTFTTTAEKGQSESVKIDLPKPDDPNGLVFQTTVNNETFKTTGAVNKGATHTTSISIFDSLGAAHELLTTWEHTNKATQEWSFKISYNKTDPEIQAWLKNPANGVVDPAAPTEAEIERANDALITDRKGTIYFSKNGKIDLSRSTIKAPKMTPAGSNPLEISLDQALVTEFNSPFTTAARDQNGYEMGLLEKIYFEADGTMRGVYSNGQKQPIGMIALASFNNPGGLEKKGKNLYEFSPNSGYPVIGKPQQGDRGSIVPGALEMSNVDLAEEFTNMIVTQRAFQANSRVITTSDEILQEVVNLKR